MLSSRIPEKERWVTGRVWPGATRGTDLVGVNIKLAYGVLWGGRPVVVEKQGAPRFVEEMVCCEVKTTRISFQFWSSVSL